MLKAKLNRLVLTRIATLFTILSLMVITLPGMQMPQTHDASLAGTWKMTSETPSGDPIPWTLTISEKDGKWIGVVDSPDSKSTPATDFKVANNKVHMKTLYQGDYYDIDLTLDGDRLTGNWSGDNGTGKTIGKRVS